MTSAELKRRTDGYTLACDLMSATVDAVTRLDLAGQDAEDALIEAFDLSVRSIEQRVNRDFRWKLMKRLAKASKS